MVRNEKKPKTKPTAKQKETEGKPERHCELFDFSLVYVLQKQVFKTAQK